MTLKNTKMMLKDSFRKEIKEKLSRQNNEQRLQKSFLIKEKFFELAEFKKAEYIMFYLATKEEVQTRLMIEEALKIGKKILVPVILKGENRIIASRIEDLKGLKSQLAPGPYGILEPRNACIREVGPEKIDLAVVPGLAFDKQNRRLGRGGGYYDRFLAGLTADTPRIGLAFSFQLLETLPALSHDIPVTKVISA